MRSDREVVGLLGRAGPAFFGNFDALRDVQRLAIPALFRGQDALVLAATASGKTEAVIAPMVARLVGRNTKGQAIRMLALAPTRALVNDLHARLEAPLQRLGWRVGRQTSDHSEATSRPDLLITTPESLDSMLVRRGVREGKQLVGHLLADVGAIFVDEAHLYADSARGDQVTWLIARMRRMRRIAAKNGWTGADDLQCCGASATVGDPEALAHRLFGGQPAVVRVPGRREMDLLLGEGEDRWLRLDTEVDPAAILKALPAPVARNDLAGIVALVQRALERPEECRKALVFVASRAGCDQLAAELREVLRRNRAIEVFGHHGSLSKESRERAEAGFSRARDAVLVATTTLEVGVDIGDVDVVVLDGAPPDVGAMLQRIGRAGRRSGRTCVVAVPRSEVQAYAFASMLDAAARGELDAGVSRRRWSVFVQQTASLVAQAGANGRADEDVLGVAGEAWPETLASGLARRVLEHLAGEDFLVRTQERLFLGDAWSDLAREGGGQLHHNLDGSNGGVPVVDAITNEVIAYVEAAATGATRSIPVAGRSYQVDHIGDEIVVRTADGRAGAPAKYAAGRRPPVSRAFAGHVRRALGFEEADAPYLEDGDEPLWFHFGGSAFELGLRALYPHLRVVRELAGLAVRGVPAEGDLRTGIQMALRERAEVLRGLVNPGPWHGYLPDEMAAEQLVALFEPAAFESWLASRQITPVAGDHAGYAALVGLLVRQPVA